MLIPAVAHNASTPTATLAIVPLSGITLGSSLRFNLSIQRAA